jgi:hypothetical protein
MVFKNEGTGGRKGAVLRDPAAAGGPNKPLQSSSQSRLTKNEVYTSAKK